jgi:hypothetical protein
MIDVSPKSEYPERYIGDGVYVSFDGYQLWLSTADGSGCRIALEPGVYSALKAYVEDLRGYSP